MLKSKLIGKFKLLIPLFLCLASYACGGGNSVAANSNDPAINQPGGGTGSTGSGTGTASFKVSWTIPVDYTDGSPLSLADIASYSLRYGTKSGNYSVAIDIKDPSTTAYQVTGLPHGKYFVTVSVKLIDGRESVYSNEVTRSI